MFKKTISLILSISLVITQPIFAQGLSQLNLAQYLGQMHPAAIDCFRPTQLRYFSYDNLNNTYRILLDKGDLKDIKDNQLKEEAKELMDYFLIGLALPNDTFWVNLRPDSPENIIDPKLEKTDLGRILLEADLQLKKDTASFTSPQTPEGKAYWDKLYKKAAELFGNENITIPTLTRPWIVPGEIIVRESQNSAYIYKATLKVMLEEDYLKNSSNSINSSNSTDYSFSDPRLKELNQYSTQLIKETIIPKLTQEVNSSKRYAQLRQVYYSLVLSRWFKVRFRSQSTENRGQGAEKANNCLSLIDSGNLTNLTAKEPYDKFTYFKQYQESFAKGEYNLKRPVSTPSGQSIRSYMSGGLVLGDEVTKVISGPNIKAVGSPVEKQLVNNSGVIFTGDKNGTGLILNEDSKLPLVIAASPLGEKLTEDDKYNNIRYVKYEKLSDLTRANLWNSFKKAASNIGYDPEYNWGFAVELNKTGGIGWVLGAVVYKKDTETEPVTYVFGDSEATNNDITAALKAKVKQEKADSALPLTQQRYVINDESKIRIGEIREILEAFSDDGKELIKRYPDSKGLYDETEKKLEIYWKTKETYDIQKSAEAALEFYTALQSKGLKVEPEIEKKIKMLQGAGAIINDVVDKIRSLIEKDIVKLGEIVNTGVVPEDLKRFSRELNLKNSKATVNYILFLLSNQFKPYREDKFEDKLESFIEDSTLKYLLLKYELEIFDFPGSGSPLTSKQIKELSSVTKEAILKYKSEFERISISPSAQDKQLLNEIDKLINDNSQDYLRSLRDAAVRLSSMFFSSFTNQDPNSIFGEEATKMENGYLAMKKAQGAIEFLIKEAGSGSPLTAERYVVNDQDMEKIKNIKYSFKMFPFEAPEFIARIRNPKSRKELQDLYQETNERITAFKRADDILKASEALREFYAVAAGFQFQESSVMPKVSEKLVELDELKSIINAVVEKVKTLTELDMTGLEEVISNEEDIGLTKLESIIKELSLNNLKSAALEMKKLFEKHKPNGYSEYVRKWASIRTELKIFDLLAASSALTPQEIKEQAIKELNNPDESAKSFQVYRRLYGISYSLTPANRIDYYDNDLNKAYSREEVLRLLKNEILFLRKITEAKKGDRVVLDQEPLITIEAQRILGIFNGLLKGLNTAASSLQEFKIGGINSNESIDVLTELTGLTIEEIERRARPGAYSKSGFISESESFKEVLKKDNAFVLGKKLTHQKLAEPLLKAMERSIFTYNGILFSVRESKYLGHQESIFNDELKDMPNYVVTNMTTKKTISFSGFLPPYILNYGFYEGAVSHRLEPIAIIDFFGITASSGLTSEPQPSLPLGGIDFTDKAMRIGLEPMGSFADLKLVLPEITNAQTLDLDSEFKQIQAMASSGIRPADNRILEFAAACYYRGEFSRRLGEITSCIQQAYSLDERLGKESSQALRLATMLPEVFNSYSLN